MTLNGRVCGYVVSMSFSNEKRRLGHEIAARGNPVLSLFPGGDDIGDK